MLLDKSALFLYPLRVELSFSIVNSFPIFLYLSMHERKAYYVLVVFFSHMY